MENHQEKLYPCKVCLLLYKTKDLAEKCEAWCREHGTCSVEISKHAVGSYGTVSKTPVSLYLDKV